jgi:hypothetical protein
MKTAKQRARARKARKRDRKRERRQDAYRRFRALLEEDFRRRWEHLS